MRRFNPEKELNKVLYGDRNKLIGIIVFLLVIIAVGSTYALYQVRHTNKLIFTTVGKFSNKDINLAIYVDNDKQDTFPDKNNYFFDKVVCDNNSYWEFDYDHWELMLKTNKKDNCNIYFSKNYRDRSRANAPELYQGMIPVYFNDGKIYIADITKEWYNYDENEWGNAILIDNTNADIKNKFYKEDGSLKVDTEVQESDILQMYVWIPRYKYQLWNVNNEGKPKQLINIAFESDIVDSGDIICTYTDIKDGTVKEECLNKITKEKVQNGEWYTHPAFKFGNTELRGIWVGKFEPSDPTDENGRTNLNKINEITILPNKTSKVGANIATTFSAERDIELKQAVKYNIDSSQIDTHMMKNVEWGAVAYLSQSIYGIYKDDKTCNIDGMEFADCRIWVNNIAQGNGTSGATYSHGGTATGCVGLTAAGTGAKFSQDGTLPAVCPDGRKWNQDGVKASTTGNMYGIYDMSGGTHEYIMGGTVNEKGSSLYLSSSGFTTTENKENSIPNFKYYDIYTYGVTGEEINNGHLGDATRELLQTVESENIKRNKWNNNASVYFTDRNSWSIYGGAYNDANAGVFSTSVGTGSGRMEGAFRSVLTAQDGED